MNKILASTLVLFLLAQSMSLPTYADFGENLGGGLTLQKPEEGPDDVKARQACEQYPDDNKSPATPCKIADAKETAAAASRVAAIVYAAAFGTCLVGCVQPQVGAVPCKVATYATVGADIIGGIVVGQNVGSLVTGMLNPGSLVSMAGGGALAAGGAAKALNEVTHIYDEKTAAGDGVNAAKSKQSEANTSLTKTQRAVGDDPTPGGRDANELNGAKEDVEKANQAEKDAEQAQQEEKNKKDRTDSCVSMAWHAGQYAIHGYNAYAGDKDAMNERRKKLDVLPKQAAAALGSIGAPGSSAARGDNPGAMQGEGTIKSGDIGQAKGVSAAQMASHAETAGQGPVLRKFEEATGHPASELFDRALAGQPPLMAAAEMTSDHTGALGSGVAADLTNGGADAIANEWRDQYALYNKNSKMGANLFESGWNGNRYSSGGSRMPDFNSIIDRILPKKVDPHAARTLASAGKSAVKTKDGFHTPDKSIFEVVNSRYQSVTPRFLAGATLVMPGKMAPSNIPFNPYLRKQ